MLPLFLLILLALAVESQQQAYTNLQEYGAALQIPDYDTNLQEYGAPSSQIPDYGPSSNSGVAEYGSSMSSAPDYNSPTGPVITQQPTSLGNEQPDSDLPTASTTPATHITGGVDFSEAVLTEDGRLCVIKDSTVLTLSKDPILECKHKNVEKCHYTYVTFFKPAQEEKCEENFEKICQIVFKQEAAKEAIRKCYRPLEKKCNGDGPEECRTLYESSCTTRYIKEGPGKFVGDTKCEKKPVEICGAGCVTLPGEEECHEKMLDTLVDVPEETCDLNPQKSCRLVTRLVPSLRPKMECTVVPQDNCNLKFSRPKQTSKPLRTEWCLDQRADQSDQQGNSSPQNGSNLDRRTPRRHG